MKIEYQSDTEIHSKGDVLLMHQTLILSGSPSFLERYEIDYSCDLICEQHAPFTGAVMSFTTKLEVRS